MHFDHFSFVVLFAFCGEVCHATAYTEESIASCGTLDIDFGVILNIANFGEEYMF